MPVEIVIEPASAADPADKSISPPRRIAEPTTTAMLPDTADVEWPVVMATDPLLPADFPVEIKIEPLGPLEAISVDCTETSPPLRMSFPLLPSID